MLPISLTSRTSPSAQPFQTVSSARNLGPFLNTGVSADDYVAHAPKQARGMLFYLKRSFATLTHNIFLPLYKAFIRLHLENAIQASSPILSGDCHALKSVQKGLRHVPYETALQQLRQFSLVRRRICGDLICMHKIMHGLLDFPCDAVFAASHPHWASRSYFQDSPRAV